MFPETPEQAAVEFNRGDYRSLAGRVMFVEHCIKQGWITIHQAKKLLDDHPNGRSGKTPMLVA